MPRSIAATFKMVETPCGGFTMYGFEVVTSDAKNAPLIG